MCGGHKKNNLLCKTYLEKSLSTSYSYFIHVSLYTKNSRKAKSAMALKAIRDTADETVGHLIILFYLKKTKNKTKLWDVSPTCSSRGRGLHVALRHFGEGVQLLHQAQGFLARQTPHLYVQGCHRQISVRIPPWFILVLLRKETHIYQTDHIGILMIYLNN